MLHQQITVCDYFNVRNYYHFWNSPNISKNITRTKYAKFLTTETQTVNSKRFESFIAIIKSEQFKSVFFIWEINK